MNKIKSMLFDMDGVLWRDQTPIGDLGKIFQNLQLHNIKFAFATNNSTKSPSEYQDKLNKFGISVKEEQIITSATTLVELLKEKYPDGGPVHILGENGLREALQQNGFHHSDRNVLAVVGGLDRRINYEKLKIATLLLQQEVDFYYTNADTTFPTPEGIIPGAGSILRALEVGSGRNAILAGKPKPKMFEIAMKIINASAESTLVIGDRLDTDILGGLEAKCFTALVLTGISTSEDLKNFAYQPHFVFENLSTLVNNLFHNNWDI
ncbi:MAG: haloacid dehalogenase [Chloroflexi bacterium HGW-Chloroflexi-2]|jgi:4-nitrophenyl phosphatase|nr:MAG: haloacid dehalogenase [Chloroflexi bacterium HGW-Chloroflexi-2]